MHHFGSGTVHTCEQVLETSQSLTATIKNAEGGTAALPRWAKVALGLLALVLVIYLSYKGLDNTYFWDDEAHVAIIARNFLASGRLTAWDGRNLHAYRNGIVLDAQLQQLGPPLDSLVVAAAFRVFGPSVWSGRLPFVIAGLLGLGVFAVVLRHDFGTETPMWLYAVGILAFTPAFLLNIRQCRYYALAILFSQLAFYAYRGCLSTKRPRYFFLLGICCALLFYSSYLLCMTFLLALCIMHLTFHGRHFGVKEWAKAGLTVAVFALATAPYMDQMLRYPDLGQGGSWLMRRATLLWWNLRDLNLLGYLPWTVMVGLLGVLLQYRAQPRTVRMVWEWGTLSIAYVFFIALFSPQPTTVPTIADVRYLIIAVPFLAGLGGVCLGFVHRKMPVVALTLLTIMVLSNMLTLTPFNQRFRWLLPAYIGEIHRHYPTSYEAVVRFLKQHAAQDDLVYTFPEFTHPPLLFYAGEQIRLCCLLDSRTPLPAATLESLQAPLFIEQHFPQWFVAFGNHPEVRKLLQYFSRPHQQEGKPVKFTYSLVEVLDVYWGATQRPELPWHSFGPKTDFDRRVEAVYIFQRLEAEAGRPW